MSKRSGPSQIVRRCASAVAAATFLTTVGAYAESPASSKQDALNKGYFPRYAAANPQVRALLCWYGMGARSAALSSASTEHGGLDRVDAEAAWDAIDKANAQRFVYSEIARMLGPDTLDAAYKAATEAANSVSQENPALVHQNEAQLAEVCGNAFYNALKEKVDVIDKFEAIYRDELATDRARSKASFMEKVMKPVHP